MVAVPELTVIRNKLARHFVGSKVTRLKIHWHKHFKQSPETIIEAISNATITEFRRVGKLIHMVLDNDRVLGIYLAEAARPYLISKPGQFSADLLEMTFSTGLGLAINDPSGKSYLVLNPNLASTDDPLHSSLTIDYLKKSRRVYKGVSIKSYMLTEKKIKGIGNAYADEVLWQIKVAPQSIFSKIPDAKLGELIIAIRAILVLATDKIQSLTDADELIPLRYDFFNVHSTGKRYDRDGHLIKRIVIRQKTAFWTDRQHIYL